jgi:hypothetical protein
MKPKVEKWGSAKVPEGGLATDLCLEYGECFQV